jgi:putative nucleotidyltransferase with HDIG domain
VPTLVLAVTPLLELAFGYASDLKLLELSNLNQPALKELIVQSPGTYHHSIIVGSLVEAAAEITGCNPLLARTCAYYHDIGKGRNPLYFGENQKGDNPHDCLAPSMSAVIIKRHVTEGLELARQYKLPRAVQDVIAQHHGTRLVGYFHHKALKDAEGRRSRRRRPSATWDRSRSSRSAGDDRRRGGRASRSMPSRRGSSSRRWCSGSSTPCSPRASWTVTSPCVTSTPSLPPSSHPEASTTHARLPPGAVGGTSRTTLALDARRLQR